MCNQRSYSPILSYRHQASGCSTHHSNSLGLCNRCFITVRRYKIRVSRPLTSHRSKGPRFRAYIGQLDSFEPSKILSLVVSSISTEYLIWRLRIPRFITARRKESCSLALLRRWRRIQQMTSCPGCSKPVCRHSSIRRSSYK